jgi:hypothetical protein
VHDVGTWFPQCPGDEAVTGLVCTTDQCVSLSLLPVVRTAVPSDLLLVTLIKTGEQQERIKELCECL